MRARLRIMGWFIIGGILIITVFTLLVAKALALMVRGVLIVGVAARTTANARCTGEVRWGGGEMSEVMSTCTDFNGGTSRRRPARAHASGAQPTASGALA